jgi:hypothetical protein
MAMNPATLAAALFTELSHQLIADPAGNPVAPPQTSPEGVQRLANGIAQGLMPYVTVNMGQGQGYAAVTSAISPGTPILPAAGSGIKWAITHIHASNTSANAVRLDINNGTTTLWSVQLPSGATQAEDFGVPLLGSANTDINALLSTSVTDVRVTLVGYQTM